MLPRTVFLYLRKEIRNSRALAALVTGVLFQHWKKKEEEKAKRCASRNTVCLIPSSKKKKQHTEKAQAHNQHAYTVSQTHPYALTTLELLPYLIETKKKRWLYENTRRPTKKRRSSLAANNNNRRAKATSTKLPWLHVKETLRHFFRSVPPRTSLPTTFI